MANKIQVMRGTKAELTTKGALAIGEPGYTTDTKELYIGNGTGANTRIGSDPHLGTTTNSGNVYSVTTTEVIGTNQKFTVKFNAASTGAPTLNVSSIGSAKAIVKAGGAAASVKIGIYTLFHDGTSFQLLGEGGEYGTATAADVLTGKTIGLENGVVNGSLAYRTAAGGVTGQYDAFNATLGALSSDGKNYAYLAPTGADKIAYDSATWVRSLQPDMIPANWLKGKTLFGVDGAIVPRLNGLSNGLVASFPGGLSIGMPPGAYIDTSGFGGQSPFVNAADANFTAANIRAGTSIFGLAGTLQPKLYATGKGVTTSSTASGKYIGANTTQSSGNAGGAIVTGLAFTPTYIRCTADNGTAIVFCTPQSTFGSFTYYKFYGWYLSTDIKGILQDNVNDDRYERMGPRGNGFVLPLGDQNGGVAFTWEAWG